MYVCRCCNNRKSSIAFFTRKPLAYMYIFLPQFLTVIFPLQVKSKPHDGVAICLFILELGMVTNRICGPDINTYTVHKIEKNYIRFGVSLKHTQR